MNYSRIANKFLNQNNNNLVIQPTKQDRRKLSMKDFGDFWKDTDNNNAAEPRTQSVDIKQNFHTPAFSMRIHTETSEKAKGSRSHHRESNDRYENGKEDYATFDINKSKTSPMKNNNINVTTFGDLEAKDSGKKSKNSKSNKKTSENEESINQSYLNPSERMKHEMLRTMMERMRFNDSEVYQEEKKISNRLVSLYELGKNKQEKNKKLQEQNEEDRLKSEMEECTFKPKLCPISKQIRSDLGNIQSTKTKPDLQKFHERNMKWKQQKEEKISKEKSLNYREHYNYSYKPKINKTNLDTVFDQSKNIQYDKNSRLYMVRLESARKDEEEKKKKLKPDLSKIANRKWKKNPDSIDHHNNSMIDMNTIRRNLHYELHENTLDDYEDYNDEYY